MDLTRRDALQIAGRCGLSLSLGGLLRAQLAAGDSAGNTPAMPLPPLRGCIFLFYYGGPSHIDTYDMKPAAPVEIRGEFQAISTSVPGTVVCEHLPRMAQRMHQVALIRSLHHSNRLHDSASTETLTGRQSPQGDREEFAPIKQFYPSYGAILHYLWRRREIEIPHAALPFVFHNVVDVPCQGGGFLGSMFDPLQISVDPETFTYQAGLLSAHSGDASYLPTVQSRRKLLDDLQHCRGNGNFDSLTLPTSIQDLRKLCDKAFALLGSRTLLEALDLSRESQASRDRYGYGPVPLKVGEGGGGGNGAELGIARQARGQNLLVARRLIEADVPFVNVYDFRQQGQNWDAHFKVFNQHKTHLLPGADQALSALIDDLQQRGLFDSTLVVAVGEFGRTPKINADGGRDHWPDCCTALLAGGGVRGGFIYGASDRFGAYPATDPVSPADLAATIFWRFGVDPGTQIHDPLGRPHPIAHGHPIKELFGVTG